ncbi:MAG: deoxynucleoside kinase [Ardenticatenaceae bacterium]|nr:deoxynucleoside kinase [Ardenticatenaceae bacterium]
MMTNNYIAIEGVIGVGKTTLARLLQPRFQATVLLEVFEENPFLAKFYQDRERYAFQTQLFFLLSRYHQQHEAVPAGLKRGNLVSDYTFAKDELFAWLNLKDDELAMYGRVHAALGEKIPKPDLIVYLRATHQELMRRIMLRDRPYERDMDPEYIRQLTAAYDAWLSNLQEIPVLIVDVNHLDYLTNEADLQHVVGLIQAALAQQKPKASGADGQLVKLENGRLPTYQQFHRQFDELRGFETDPFVNYILLAEEMGEVASEMIKIWRDGRVLAGDGRSPQEAHLEAIAKHRATLKGELADLLAYILKLANYTGIDLEQAYVEKMKVNMGRQWGAVGGGQ